MVPADAVGAVDPQAARRLVRALTATIFIQWAGGSAVIPMLPVYLARHGGSDGLAGVVMGAFFLAGVATQYPAGRLADRVGRRPVLLGGLLCFSGASLAFLLPLGPVSDVPLRALQGMGAGAAEVAALAMVAAAVPIERRGTAFGQVYGGLIAGLAVGPLFGSLAGPGRMDAVFVAASIASLAACLPVARLALPTPAISGRPGTSIDHPAPRVARVPEGAAEPRTLSLRGRGDRALWGAVLGAAAIGLTTGVYETCWTLLLELRRATDWEIGLSWTLFAAPFVVMARPAGWLADHVDRRYLAVGALASSAGFCALYPWVHSVPIVLGLAVFEAAGAAIAIPAVQSLLTQSVPAPLAGRAQGLFASSETATTGVAAGAGGALFALAPWAPFTAGALFSLALVAVLPLVWHRVPGRVRDLSGTAGGSSGLQVPDGGRQLLELGPPAGRGVERSHDELGEPDPHEALEEFT